MSEQNRGFRRNPQNRDTRPQGGNREADDRNASYALQITRCIHDPYGATLVVEAQAVRGKKPARNMLVELLVNEQVVHHDTTTWSGIVKFLVRDVKLPIGKYSATVRAVGVVGNEHELMIQATEQFDVRPSSVVPFDATYATSQCTVENQETGFAVTCVVTTMRDDIPVPNEEVDLVGFSVEDCSLQTDRFGIAKTVFHIPYLEDGSAIFIPYRVLVLSTGTMLSDVLVLIPPPQPIPHDVNFGDPAEMPNELGTYHVRVKAEDKEGQPVKGVRFTVTAAGEPLPVIKTNRYGEALFTLKCDPEKDMTKFVIDVPGIEKSKEYDLMSERGRQIRIRKTETKLLLTAPVWHHAKQAYRRGAGDIRYTKPVPDVSAEPKVESTFAEAPVVEVVAEVLPRQHEPHSGLRMKERKVIHIGVGEILAGITLLCALTFFSLWLFDVVPVATLFLATGLCIGSALVTWLLTRNNAQALRYVYAHRRQIGIYGLTRPVFGFLGFCWGTNNRRANILLFLIVPAACTYLVWVAVLAVQAYLQHPLSEQLPNVVSGTPTTLIAYREVPMHLGTYLMWLGGLLLGTFFAILYWVASKREEIERNFMYYVHLLQVDRGEVIKQKGTGLVRKWVEIELARRQMHPVQQPTGTPRADGAAPAKSGKISGHTIALTMLTIAEFADWFLTVGKMIFGGKK